MIFKPNDYKIKPAKDYRKILRRVIFVLLGIAFFLLGFFSATPIMSLFR